MLELPQTPGKATAQTTQSLLPTQQPCLRTTLAPEVSPIRYQGLPDPHWGASRRRGSRGAVASRSPGTHPVGTSPAKEASGASGARSPGGSIDTESSAVPPRNPAVPLQRVDSDTEKKTLVPGPSAAVRVASLVPLPGWGIPGEAGKLGVGTQALSSWEEGSSPQINCTKCDTGVIHVGRKALRWGHRVCVCVWGCDSHQEVREGLMKG